MICRIGLTASCCGAPAEINIAEIPSCAVPHHHHLFSAPFCLIFFCRRCRRLVDLCAGHIDRSHSIVLLTGPRIPHLLPEQQQQTVWAASTCLIPPSIQWHLRCFQLPRNPLRPPQHTPSAPRPQQNKSLSPRANTKPSSPTSASLRNPLNSPSTAIPPSVSTFPPRTMPLPAHLPTPYPPSSPAPPPSPNNPQQNPLHDPFITTGSSPTAPPPPMNPPKSC